MDFINFDTLTIDSLRADLTSELENTKAFIAQLDSIQESSWAAIIKPLQLQLGKLQHVWGIIEHLHSVKDSEELRNLHEEFLPSITDFYVNMGQNATLFKHVKNIAKNNDSLNEEQKRVIENDLRDFKLAGIDLPERPARSRSRRSSSVLSEHSGQRMRASTVAPIVVPSNV
jgi:oligopeptidase A